MLEHETCSRCGRKLKTEKSKRDGFGPVCKKKWEAANADQIEAKLDPDVLTNGELETEGIEGLKE